MEFCAKEIKISLIQWTRDWFDKNGKGCNAVIGISGKASAKMKVFGNALIPFINKTSLSWN